MSWGAVKYAESYDVYRSSSPTSGFTKVAEGVTSTYWTDEKPLLGKNYYRIYANGHGVTSSASNTTTVVYITCPDHNHPHMINLGLPSGKKWACCNVGATKPEEYGGYYAWGETAEKEVYNPTTYKYYQNGSYVSLGSNISGTEYDVAHVKWGGNWRMPTKDDIQELLGNSTSEWTTLNDVKGKMFTSKMNGNSIFLPAAGSRSAGGLDSVGYGYYWLSTLFGSFPDFAYTLEFSSNNARYDYTRRLLGLTVRPVR